MGDRVVRVELSFGRGFLPLDLPDDWAVTVVRKPAMPVLPDPAAAVVAALRAPVDSPTLRDLAAAATSACVLICDITRPVPNGVILPGLIRELLDAGMAADAITVLVATGLHRPNEGDELRELVGDSWVLETVKVANHFARNEDDHAYVGTTSAGNVIRLDKRLLDADLKIATGLVEPHFMAGYSGGRKVIAPGVAHAETITTFHSARYMENPRAVNCVLDGNPLHDDQLEIVEMIGGAVAVNAVIDDSRRLSFVNFGEIRRSHLDAVAFIRRFAEVPVTERFATVVTSSAGHPLDKTYYQTVKSMVGPIDILAPGGNLIIASECSEGMGSPEYVAAQRRLAAEGPERFLEGLKKKTHAAVDEWQTEMQLKPMRVGTVHLYAPGLSVEERGLTGVTMTDSLEATIRDCVAASGERRVAVVPEGPYVVPYYEPRRLSAE